MLYIETLLAKGYPEHIVRDGYVGHLVGEQPLLAGEATPIYRFPGGVSIADDIELKMSREAKREAVQCEKCPERFMCDQVKYDCALF